MNDRGRPHSAPATSRNDLATDGTTASGAKMSVVPTLIVAFELEAPARALNRDELTDDELVRLVDWITQRPGFGALDLRGWLDRIRCEREERAA